MCHLEVQFHQEHFILDSSKALIHPASRSIIIADVHLGKTTHFRKFGIAVPTNIATNDLNKLLTLIKTYQPKKVIIAGDFFHASANSEIEMFKKWRQQFLDIEFILIKGNHDRLKQDVYAYLDLTLYKKSLALGNFEITHHPKDNPHQLTICGHIHPGVSLRLRGKQYVRLPSFVFQENQIIIPAFSDFTGLDTSLQKSGKNYVITATHILEV